MSLILHFFQNLLLRVLIHFFKYFGHILIPQTNLLYSPDHLIMFYECSIINSCIQ